MANRKLMNTMLLRNDFELAQTVIENVSEDLINEWNHNIENSGNFTHVTGLMAALYTWAIKGIEKTGFVSSILTYTPINIDFLVLVFMMIGDTRGNREINQLLPEFSVIVQEIFERTAPLMTIPPTFARKYNLKVWSDFEDSVVRTLEIANEIVDIGLKVNGNGLLKEMQSNQMSTEMIKRIFVDLIIAAGDTVNNNNALEATA